jgi:hypothetical protein
MARADTERVTAQGPSDAGHQDSSPGDCRYGRWPVTANATKPTRTAPAAYSPTGVATYSHRSVVTLLGRNEAYYADDDGEESDEERCESHGLQIVLARKASLVDGAALTALEHDLEEPHACMDEQRSAGHIRHLEHLSAGDARLHKARGDVDH